MGHFYWVFRVPTKKKKIKLIVRILTACFSQRETAEIAKNSLCKNSMTTIISFDFFTRLLFVYCIITMYGSELFFDVFLCCDFANGGAYISIFRNFANNLKFPLFNCKQI